MHHGAGLRRALIGAGQSAGQARETLTAIVTDYRKAELDPPDRTMLDYVMKITRTPWQIVEADIEGLRRAGFDDLAIHDMCTIAAYYAFVNRIADGLGVELEPGHAEAGDPRPEDYP